VLINNKSHTGYDVLYNDPVCSGTKTLSCRDFLYPQDAVLY